MESTSSTAIIAAWDAVADVWDTCAGDTEALQRESTEAFVTALALRPGQRLLELAAGPGELAGRWAELVGPTGTVVVSDGAAAMVAAAERRVAALANVTATVVEFDRIPGDDAAFDAVACRHGLMFSVDPLATLTEIRRVLVPGGRLAALTWAGMEHNPWMVCVGMSAMINGLLGGGPPVGPGQVFSLGDPERLTTLAEQAGFVDVGVTAQPARFTAASVAEHVANVAGRAGPMAAAFAAATPDQLAAVVQTATELAAPYTAPDGSVALPGRSLLLTAAAPTRR